MIAKELKLVSIKNELSCRGERAHEPNTCEDYHNENVEQEDERSFWRSDGHVVEEHGEYEIERDEADGTNHTYNVAEEGKHRGYERTKHHVECS